MAASTSLIAASPGPTATPSYKMIRSVWPGYWAGAQTTPSSAAATPAAAAAPCGSSGYHYAQHYTSQTNNTSHCQGFPAAYFGWAGIEGSIAVPGSGIVCSGTCGHVLGAAGVGLQGGQIQMGWYVGGIGGGSGCDGIGASTPHLYLEWYFNGSGSCNGQVYHVMDLGAAPAGGSFLFYIQYVATRSCWQAAINGNEVQCISGLPTSGSPNAGIEVFDGGGANSTATVPSFDIGTQYPLYLKRWDGYKLWNPANLVGYNGTTTYDERYSDHPCVKLSDYANYYRFLVLARPASGC